MNKAGQRTGAHGRILILGRALHAPWNEGARVIGWSVAQAARMLGPVQVVSLTREAFRGQADLRVPTEHVYTARPDSTRGDYQALASVIARVGGVVSVQRPRIAHIVGLPLVLAVWLRRRGIRTVVHVNLVQQVYMARTERLRGAARRRLFDRWIDAYACSSPRIVEDLARQGYDRTKLHLLPPPINTALFQPQDQAAARRAWNMDPSAFVVVYVGTVSPRRFPADDVLHALTAAAVAVPNLRLEVFAPVGTHSYNVGWADDNVRRAAQTTTLPVQVHLQDLTEKEKAAVYSAADVVILPFTAPVAVEPPLTLLEAMACGTPVVVAPHANRSEVVDDGVNGLVFDGPDALAAAIRRLGALGTAGRAALGAAGRHSVVAGYSFAATAEALQGLWATLGGHDAARATPQVARAPVAEQHGP